MEHSSDPKGRESEGVSPLLAEWPQPVGTLPGKERRQRRILELVREREVRTQLELLSLLRAAGLPVTQGTVSRDIRELGLRKVPTPDGSYRYVAPEPAAAADRLLEVFRSCVIDMVYSENILVVHTLAGTADGVCEAIDALHLPEVIGTLSGERTVLLVLLPKEAAPAVLERLRHLLGGS